MHFATAIRSSSGGRSKNQDAATQFSQNNLAGWVLADGLGGHRGGGLASSLATRAIVETCQEHDRFSAETVWAAAQAAQESLHERQRNHLEYSQMRTTFVLLLTDPDEGTALWGHAGDSRLYHFRDGAVMTRTKDHSAVQALVEAGELDPDEMRDHEMGHRITRSLGDSGDANPDVVDSASTLKPGDAFLLCSDGFWEGIAEDRMARALTEAVSVDEWIDAMTAHIENTAEADHDNYTAVAVFVDGTRP